MQTDNKRKGIEGIVKWPFLHGRLTSEKSFVAVIVVVVVLSKSDRFSESSQQQALDEVPSNLDVKCRRAERYCFPLFSFFSLSLFFMKGETTQEHEEDCFQE